MNATKSRPPGPTFPGVIPLGVVMNAREFCTRTGISHDLFNDWVKLRGLNTYRISGKTYVSTTEWFNWLQNNQSAKESPTPSIAT